MINYDDYKDYSLLHWCYEHLEDVVDGVAIRAQIRGQMVITAICTNINVLIDFLGFSVLDSAVDECWGSPDNLFWSITIDLDKTGKFEE